MTGINSGILHNARPLTTAEITELEVEILQQQKVAAYLDENSKICFIGPAHTNLYDLLELACHYAILLDATDDIVTKEVYRKIERESFVLFEVFTKPTINDPWTPLDILTSTLDGGLLDEIILA